MAISNLFSTNAYDIHARTFSVPLGCDGVEGAIILKSGRSKKDVDGKLVRDARGRAIGIDDVKITYESMRTMLKLLQGLMETVAHQAQQIKELTLKLSEKVEDPSSTVPLSGVEACPIYSAEESTNPFD